MDDFLLLTIHAHMQDDKKTINQKEVETLNFWENNSIFEKSITTPGGDIPQGSFSFYDGPPFATGLPHFGHILAGTIKDAIPRYHTMKGCSVRRVWGWDCHGLPIENLIEKKLGLASKKDIEDFGIDKFNRDAYESVLQYEEEWKRIIPRLGRWVDMEHPYKTMDATYTESIWWAWKELMNKGLAYEGNKMMHICPRCETPLAQSEVGLEYHDVTDLSVTAEFELVEESGTYVLAWTTTPWTLPGNTALAVHRDMVYVKVKSSFEGKTNFYILAKSKVEGYFKESTSIEIVEEFTGDKLVGKSYKPVFPYFIDKEIENKEHIWKIWHADFITEEAGTGIAHEAPAFGADDMDLAKANNIPVIKHVKMDGTFTSDVVDFSGMKVKQKDDTQSADIEIVKWLAHNGKLFEKHKIIHSYPLCWRCKTPLLNYATSSWFIDVPQIKNKLISENQQIGWTPEHVKEGRFGKWLEGAREWAVSRSRYWGAPLPIWKNADGSKIHVIGSLAELAEKNKAQPKNTYYVMRHGESQNNIQNIYDSSDYEGNSLTEAGVSQVKETGELLKQYNIDLIVYSPFIRTAETTKIVAETLGVPSENCISDIRLREHGQGELDGMKVDYVEHLALWKKHTQDLDSEPRGIESYRKMAQRSAVCVEDLEKKYQGRNILIITHLGVAKALLYTGNLSPDEQIIRENYTDHKNSPAHFKNAEVKPLTWKSVPRDETGAINLHRPYIDEVQLEISGETYTRIPDVFDCWYESGSMPFASLHYPFENKEVFEKNFPADFIAEGMDQTRGWFYSLINLSVGLFVKAPYKHVIVNGLVLSDSGVKLSKSEKNYTDPMELVEKYGADAMRYALLASPVVKGENIAFNDEMVSDVYKKIILRLENIVSLYTMNVPDDVVATATSPHVLDTWILGRVHELRDVSTQGYEAYMLDDATKGVNDFVDDLSVWYVRRSRDRLKGDTGKEDQMFAYQTLAYVLTMLAKVIAPVMPFIAERVYGEVCGEKESVHLESWPTGGEINKEVLEEMVRVREVVSSALSLRTQAKISVRQPLQKLTIPHEIKEKYHEMIQDEVNVKEIVVDTESSLHVDVTLTNELIQEGDVRNLLRAVQDARKEKGLSPKDIIVLVTSYIIPPEFLEDFKKTCNVQTIEKGEGEYSVVLSSGAVSFGIRVA